MRGGLRELPASTLMKLVVELDDLKEVGLAVKDSPAALARVEQLILASPSLVDVIGVRAVEEPEDDLAERALGFLLDNPDRWFSTQAIARACKTQQEGLLRTRLKDLRADGEVVARKKGQGYEWKVA